MEMCFSTLMSEEPLYFAAIVLLICVCSLVIYLMSISSHHPTAKDPSLKKKQKETTAKKPTRVLKCPFSSETTFVQELAEHLPPYPLDRFADWKDHLGARWLAAGISGQDTPGMLRTGLKRLRHADHFLVQDFNFAKELKLKTKNLDDPERRKERFIMEQGSLEAQWETLELLMAVLPVQYPELYTYNKDEHSIKVHLISTTFYINDWKHCPLELCERIVQEDLILMRPGEPQPGSKQPMGYYMAAAGVVFSFSSLPEKLGQPIEFIHAPIPAYQEQLSKSLNLMFHKIKVEQPLWRNNWAIAMNGNLGEPMYGSDWTANARHMEDDMDVSKMFLKVEYQTIRRLPKSDYILFTVRTFLDPISGLEQVDRQASLCLARSIRGMSPAMHRYKGIGNGLSAESVLEYLDTISTS